MSSKAVLISDDINFFDYIISQIKLRKSDEVFKYTFDDVPKILHLITSAVLIINSENAEEKTLELLRITQNCACVVFAYNQNVNFETLAFKSGAYAFITPHCSQEELQAKLIHVFAAASNLEKNRFYRELLVSNNLIMPNNEVFINYELVLDKELKNIQSTSTNAVLAAISPNDKSKFLLNANQIETVIINNIRKNDILMNYAPNKYFLILHNTDIKNAQKIWEKIDKTLPEKIYAGFANIMSKNRQQLVNEALNKLHEAINYDKNIELANNTYINPSQQNFKIFKQEFQKRMAQIIYPTFYLIQQKYNQKLYGVIIDPVISNDISEFRIQNKNTAAYFKITTPGCSKINIDINYKFKEKMTPKRITLEPEEFEKGVLEDLLEQFIEEFKKEIGNEYT